MTQSEAGKLGYLKAKPTIEKKYKEAVDEYYRGPKICERCGKVLEYKNRHNRFCSRSCAASITNIERTPNNYYKGERFCLYCGKKGIGDVSLFCSAKCHSMFVMYEKIWRNEASFVTVKRYLLHINGNICSECGITSWNGKDIVMELEHINGNSSDNSLENVCLLCPNCHSQTPTYKSRNKGNGRAERRKRYKEGKSY